MKEIYLDLRELAFDIDDVLHSSSDRRAAEQILKVITDKFEKAGIPVMTDTYGSYFYAGENVFVKMPVEGDR